MNTFLIWRQYCRLFTAAAFLVCVPFGVQAQEIAERQMDNGLRVVVIPGANVPVVTQMLVYQVGAVDEQAGKTGLAHFLEHLMFKGTAQVPSGEFSYRVAQLGGEENATTTSDYTAYYQTVGRDHLDEVMMLEADRMANLVIAPDEVASELDVVLEERRTRVDNNPTSLLYEKFSAALFGDHPYAWPIIGTPDDLRGLTRDDALAFYRKFYGPERGILVLAGGITPEDGFALAEKYYGGIPKNGGAVPSLPAAPKVPKEKQVTLAHPRVEVAQLWYAWLAPSHGDVSMEQSAAISVLQEILGGGSTSRLYQDLVVTHGVALGAGASYDGSNRGPGSFMVYATLKDGVAMEQLEDAVDEVLRQFVENGITERELSRAKTNLRADFIYAQDSASGMARIVGGSLAAGWTLDQIRSWPDLVGDVTVQQVKAAAKRLLEQDRKVVAHLLPEAGQ